MRRLVRLAGFVLALILGVPVLASDASGAFKKGADAEGRQNYVQAYEFYKQAYEAKPKDIKYRAAYTRMRFYASSDVVKHGLALKEQGKLDEALAEFQHAVQIDPSNFFAAQELRRTQMEIQSHQGTAPSSEDQPQNQSYLSNLAQHAEGPVELRPISNTPITLRSTEDTKSIYTAIGKIAGLNVLFDADYTSRRITIELNGVSLNEALGIIAIESKTFWRPVTPNTIFVAADTPAKRKELEQSVVKTFYLGNVSSPNDLQDSVNAVRQILDIQRIQPIASQNAIVVRGTPDQIAMAEKLLDDIDKAKPEVVVEIAVMQVRRDKTRTIGVNPPTNTSVQLTNNATTTTTSSNNNSSNNTAASTTTGNLNLNTFAHLNATNFQVTVPALSFSALLNDSNTKLIQNPQIRALDSQKASLKIGDRVPVATGSFQPGIGGVGINPLVNTQFQYIDVGVNIDITPRIHSNREVTLKLTMEISSVTGQSNIGGISQPIIGQRRIEHEIRLREGEVNLLGGILEDSEQTSLNGYPGLAKIPILKYFFAQENKVLAENEIVFALVPHIVRAQDISRSNREGIDVGTANAVELRMTPPPAPPPTSTNRPPASAPAAAPATQPAAPAAQQQGAALAQPAALTQSAVQNQTPVNASAVQPSAPTGAAPATSPPAAAPSGSLQAGNAVLSFEPASANQAVNSTFVVNVSLGGAQNVYSVPAQISYDPKILQLLNVSNGGLLGKDGAPVALVHREDPSGGVVNVTATRPPGAGGINGQGPVFTLTFMAKAAGQATLNINHASARDPGMQAIPVAGSQAMITVK